MKTVLAILGFLFLLGILFFIAYRKGLLLGLGLGAAQGSNPNDCKPDKVGYRNDGVKDSKCGQVPCNPNKPGFDIDDFPDFNCETGRVENNSSATQREKKCTSENSICGEPCTIINSGGGTKQGVVFCDSKCRPLGCK